MKIEYFKATKKTRRFNKNQKVWISLNCANHLYINFKWRGKGRYVRGIIDKHIPTVGEIKEIEVDKIFGERITRKI